MTRYVCSICNYKFEREHFNPKSQCPYCGKKGTIKREASASEILSEVDSIQ